MAVTNIKGLGDLTRNLRQFPEKLQRRILTQAMRQGTNIITGAAKALCPVDSGALRDSIRTSARRGTPTSVIFTVSAGSLTFAKQRKYQKDAYYAVMVEKGHLIRGRGQALQGGTRRRQAQRAQLTEYGAASVPAHPYMRPALENNAQSVIDQVADQVRNRLPEAVN